MMSDIEFYHMFSRLTVPLRCFLPSCYITDVSSYKRVPALPTNHARPRTANQSRCDKLIKVLSQVIKGRRPDMMFKTNYLRRNYVD